MLSSVVFPAATLMAELAAMSLRVGLAHKLLTEHLTVH